MTPESIAALVNMGAAGALIVVVVIFLKRNKESETAFLTNIEKRDQEWRNFFTAVNASNAADIGDMRIVALRITTLLEELIAAIAKHDAQAKEVAAAVADVKVKLVKLTPPKVKKVL